MIFLSIVAVAVRAILSIKLLNFIIYKIVVVIPMEWRVVTFATIDIPRNGDRMGFFQLVTTSYMWEHGS